MSQLTLASMNHYGADYILFQDEICRKLGTVDYDRIILETSEDDEELKKLGKLPNTKIINGSDVNQFKGSYAHGYGINQLFKYLDTKYTIILDPDVIPLVNNWDQIMLDNLNEYDLTGVPYNPLHGRRRIQGVPTVFFLVFETKILKKLNLDWTSARQWFRVPLARILYKLGNPKIFDFEASYKVLRTIKKSGLKYKAFEMVQPWEDRAKLKFDISYLPDDKKDIDPLLHVYPEEWWYKGNPFLSHQRRSWRASFNKSEYSKDWIQTIINYLK